MSAIVWLLLLAVPAHAENFTRYPQLAPHSLEFGLVAATDSVRYAWTMPTRGVNGDTLRSRMTPELWVLLQFAPPFPPRWDLRFRVWAGSPRLPGEAVTATIPVYGFGSVWVESIGPGGRSPGSNCAPSRLQ